MDEYYAKKQEGFKARYVEGDTKIDICKCGNYYLNEVPRGNGACELRTKCRSCAMVINDLTYQRRVGEVVLREQVKVLRQENKVLETEVVKLRQLVANYQRKG